MGDVFSGHWAWALSRSFHFKAEKNVLKEKSTVIISVYAYLYVCAWTLGNSEEPKAADADVISLLKKMAGVDEETSDTEKLALVAFLYLFCSIAVKNRLVNSILLSWLAVFVLLQIQLNLFSSWRSQDAECYISKAF